MVEWRNVHLQRNESDKSPSDPFTFQAILRQNGDVTFAYKSVPLDINSIKDHDHPVKVRPTISGRNRHSNVKVQLC